MKRLFAILLVAAGCAAPTTTANAPEASIAEAPRGVDRFADERARIDRAGVEASCDEVQSGPTEASWLGAWCAYRTGQFEQMATSARRAQRYFGETGQIRRSAEAWLLVGLAEVERGRLDRALQAVVRAQDLIDWGRLEPVGKPDDLFAADLAYLEAQLLARGLPVLRSSPKSSDLLLEAALRGAEAQRQRAMMAHVLRALGPARFDSGNVRGALDAVSSALAVELRDENPAGIAATLEVSAELAARLGVPEVRAWLSGADFEFDDEVLPGTPDFDGAMRLRMSDFGRRQLARKIAAYRSSPDARLRPDSRLMDLLLDPETLRYSEGRSWDFTFHAGLLLRDVGAFEESRAYLESSVDTIESTRATIPDISLRQRFFAGKRVAYHSLVEHYVGIAPADRPRADIRRALAVANRTKARGLLDLLDGTVDPEMTIAPTVRWEPTERVRAKGEAMQARLKTWVNRPAPRRPSSDAFDRLDEFAARQTGVRYIEYVIGARVGFVFVSGADTLEVRKLPGADELEPRVRDHVRLLRDPSASPEDVRTNAERLYVDLVGPIQDLIVDSEHLVIAPDIAIEGVEFSALARPTKRRTPRWIVRDHAVSYVPSTAVARRISERSTPISKGSLLLGDPDLDRSALALAALTPAAAEVAFDRLDKRFAPLPGARKEVQSIESYAPEPARARSGAAATESLVLRPRVIPLDLLHIAAHGVADGASSLDVEQPAILLAKAPGAPRDGILTLEEILVLKPRARVVTLSGCETGVGWQSLGDGAFGLAGAFLFAGSDVVVASRWKVEDDATRRLMTSFYANRKRGEAEALRRAQVTQSKRLAPFYWASFRVFGDLPASSRRTE